LTSIIAGISSAENCLSPWDVSTFTGPGEEAACPAAQVAAERDAHLGAGRVLLLQLLLLDVVAEHAEVRVVAGDVLLELVLWNHVHVLLLERLVVLLVLAPRVPDVEVAAEVCFLLVLVLVVSNSPPAPPPRWQQSATLTWGQGASCSSSFFSLTAAGPGRW
jgi:hypothetical protein